MSNFDILQTIPPGSHLNQQRSRNGCLTCRARKVKCNEEKPICDRCRIGERSCTWATTDVNTKRRRISKSSEAAISSGTGTAYASAGIIAAFAKQQGRRSSSSWFLPSPSSRKGGSLDPKSRLRLMLDPSFLSPYFPAVDSRLIIRHYLSKTSEMVLAFTSQSQPFNPWIGTHFPLALDHSSGSHPASDALRIAIEAVGAVHLRYIADPSDQAGARKISSSAREQVVSLIEEASHSNEKEKQINGRDVEIILGALLSCIMASSLAADDAWDDLMTAVLTLISSLGGPTSILLDTPKDQFSIRRFLLEQFAVRDVIGCMTTGRSPALLNEAFTPWFFEVESWSETQVEWESIERMFGISRGMVDVMARACTIISKALKTGFYIHENPEQQSSNQISQGEGFQLKLPQHIIAKSATNSIIASTLSVPSHVPSPASPSFMPELLGIDIIEPDFEVERQSLEQSANDLLAELKVWEQCFDFTPLHPRTQYGNHCYRHAMRIALLRDVFRVSENDERVKSSSKAIVELCKEMVALYGRMNWLSWPLLIAGFHIAADDPGRQSVVELLRDHGPDLCYDSLAAVNLMTEFWRQRDGVTSDGQVTHWDISKRTGRKLFVG